MSQLREQTGGRRWGAALAAAFCGYLTLATSEIPSDRCLEEQSTALRPLTHEAESATTWWRLTAVTPTPVLRWHVQVSPAKSLAYAAPAGANVPAFAEPITAQRGAEAPVTDGVDTTSFSTAAPAGASSGGVTFEAVTSDGSSSDLVTLESGMSASGLVSPALPSDHVLLGVGSLTLVCGGDPALCDDVKFSVHGQVGDEFTLSAFAIRRGCAPEGELMDLRLEPAQP